MKLCDVVQFYSPLGGGVRRYLDDKMQYIANHNDIQHDVIVPSHQNAIDILYDSRLIEIKSMRLIGSLSYRMLLNRSRILSILDQEQPDIIEVGDPYRSAWISLEGARLHQIPIAAFYHSDFPRALGRTIQRFCGTSVERILSNCIQRYIVNLYNQMSVTIVASQRLQKILTECGIKRIVCIPLGTDISVFQPDLENQSIREELGLNENDRLLLYIGRLAREKNIHSLIGMMDQLSDHPCKTNRQTKLLLVGDGELRGMVQKAVQERNDIEWHGYCQSSKKLAAYYNAADLFVHAGTYETFGITSLEAQACGTRVLAIRGGGLDDTVQGETPLIMADSSSPADLAYCVKQIEDVESNSLQEQRRLRIVRHFSIQTTFNRIFALYRHILAGYPVEEYAYPEEETCAKDHHPAILSY